MSKTAQRIGATLVAAVALLAGGVLPAAAATGSTAGHSAGAQCGQGRITVSASMQHVQSPVGRPVTAAGQHVAHRAFLYRWTGEGWRHEATSNWLWGYASGGQSTTTFRTYDTSQTASAQFTVATGQYYAVVVQYYWYPNADVGSGSDFGAAQHVDMGGPSNGYCKA
jgi:hypothetical protein